ncbi:MAG: NAD-dependent deacetylase [Bacteroidetes bacterium]|nr:NAD-dependent deacetylase [Bacteroidota bacterium]
MEENIIKAAEAVKDADAILITAGAGMGVDSGLPDFRGKEGFWKAYPPIARLGISFTDMANPQWFHTNPQIAWAFYGHRLNLYRKTVPHAGFSQLLEIGKSKSLGYFVFTSNVDGQFQKAGFDDDLIEECHGSIHHLQCISPCTYHIWDAADTEIIVDMETFEARHPLPKCINCNAVARPNILMFGDWNWIQDRSSAQGERLYRWLNDIRKNSGRLVIIEIGAGTMVATVRYQSEGIAAKMNGTLIRINPRDYHVPHGHISIPFVAAEGIAGICDSIV